MTNKKQLIKDLLAKTINLAETMLELVRYATDSQLVVIRESLETGLEALRAFDNNHLAHYYICFDDFLKYIVEINYNLVTGLTYMQLSGIDVKNESLISSSISQDCIKYHDEYIKEVKQYINN